MVSWAFANAFDVAGTGPYPIIAAGTPAVAIEIIFALGLIPKANAFSSLITTKHDAPSDKADEVPAVTVPFTGSNTGRSCARVSSVVSGRITSSCLTKNGIPFSSCPITGTISLSNNPSNVA